MDRPKRKAQTENESIHDRDTKKQRYYSIGINDFPLEILTRILVFVPAKRSSEEFIACRLWAKIARQQEYWRLKCIARWGNDMPSNIARRSADGSIEFDSSKFYWPVIQGDSRTLLNWCSYYLMRVRLERVAKLSEVKIEPSELEVSTIEEALSPVIKSFGARVFSVLDPPTATFICNESRAVAFELLADIMEVLFAQGRHREALEMFSQSRMSGTASFVRWMNIVLKLEEKRLLSNNHIDILHSALRRVTNVNYKVKEAFKENIKLLIRSSTWIDPPDPDSSHPFGLDSPNHHFNFLVMHLRELNDYKELLGVLLTTITEVLNDVDTDDKDRITALAMACFGTVKEPQASLGSRSGSMKSFNEQDTMRVQKPFLNEIFSMIKEEIKYVPEGHIWPMKYMIYEIGCRFNCSVLSDENLNLLFNTVMEHMGRDVIFNMFFYLESILNIGEALGKISDDQFTKLNNVVIEHAKHNINKHTIKYIKYFSRLSKIFKERMKPFIPRYKSFLCGSLWENDFDDQLMINRTYISMAYHAGCLEEVKDSFLELASNSNFLFLKASCGKIYTEVCCQNESQEFYKKLAEQLWKTVLEGRLEYRDFERRELHIFRLLLRVVQKIDKYSNAHEVLENLMRRFTTFEIDLRTNEHSAILYLMRQIAGTTKKPSEIPVIIFKENILRRGFINFRASVTENSASTAIDLFFELLTHARSLSDATHCLFELQALLSYCHTFTSADQLLKRAFKMLTNKMDLLDQPIRTYLTSPFNLATTTLVSRISLISSYLGWDIMKKIMRQTFKFTHFPVDPLGVRSIVIKEYNKRTEEDPFKPLLCKMIILCSVCAVDPMFKGASLSNNDVKVNLPLNENGEEYQVDTGVDEINQMVPSKINGLTFSELLAWP